MPVDAVVGACWGDEGKGKLTDFLAEGADYVVRFQGGRNAGHTIVNDLGRFALHGLPSGVFRAGVVNVLGPGVAVDLAGLAEELAQLREAGVPDPELRISDRAQLVLPIHGELDRLEEGRLGAARFGSTGVGIAPFYADKAMKLGIQVADLGHPDRLRERVAASLAQKNVLLEHLYGAPTRAPERVAEQLLEEAAPLRHCFADTDALLGEALRDGRHILLEGQLGALRDPDHGVYPFSTSSSPLAGFGCVGAGLPPTAFRRIVAVAKAYSTCVGATPFVGELQGPRADAIRRRGGEFGATTGRPRRIAFFDAVAARYGCRIQGATEVALTMLDVLTGERELPVCVAYRIDGRVTERFVPVADLARAEPVYEIMEGWTEDLRGARRPEDLPPAARRYVDRLEQLMDTPIGSVSVGPEREAIIDWTGAALQSTCDFTSTPPSTTMA